MSDQKTSAGSDQANADRETRVRERAYALWEKSGRPEGEHETHWHEAVRQTEVEDGGEVESGPQERDPAEGSRETAEANLEQAERDAAPQFARTRRGSTNSGVSSAEPRVISGDEGGDATFPLKQSKGKRRST